MGRVAVTGEIVAELAHEIGEPLQVISNYVVAMQAAMKGHNQIECAAIDTLIDPISRAAGYAQNVVKRVRSFMRDSTFECECFDINDLIRSTTEFFEFELRNDDIVVNYELTPASTNINGDTVQIQQVLINLMLNAIAAMKDIPADARELRIRTSLDTKSNNVVVQVHDTGCGLDIDPDSVFEPFVTTKKNGLGMGLAICARIVRSHSGDIRIGDAKNGTSFEFELPASKGSLPK